MAISLVVKLNMLFLYELDILGVVNHTLACITATLQLKAFDGMAIGVFSDTENLDPSADTFSAPAFSSEFKNKENYF